MLCCKRQTMNLSVYRVGKLCRTHNPLKKQLPSSDAGSPMLLSPFHCLRGRTGSCWGVSSVSRRWGSRSWSQRCRRRMRSGLGRSLESLPFCKHSGHTAVHSSSSLLWLWKVTQVRLVSAKITSGGALKLVTIVSINDYLSVFVLLVNFQPYESFLTGFNE